MHRASSAQVVTECIAERLKTQRVDIVDRMQPRLPAVVVMSLDQTSNGKWSRAG
jgi:hypothetical protein